MSSEPFVASHQPLPPEEEDRIGSLLRLHLSRDEIASRQGAGNSRYSYLATNKAVELANYIFGYDGWSSSIQDVTIDFLEESKEGRWNVGVSCIMRVTLRAGSYHEDVGYGQTVNMPGKAEALEKAKKEACSDGLKRAMRLFGNKLGNSLSDQHYMQLLKSGKGQKEPLDLSTSPRKRMRLEPALTASTQLQQQPQYHHHNNNNNSMPPPPQSPQMADGYPASPQQPYQPPPAASPTKPVSPNAAAPPLHMSPGASPAATLAAHNRQPVPSPPAAIAPSAASYPYKPRNPPAAASRPIVGKENVAAAGGVSMDTSAINTPLPSIHGIIHSLPASAHAAAMPYSTAAFTPTVKQEAPPSATAPYGPPSIAPRTFPTNQPPSTTSNAGSYASTSIGTAATFPVADSGGGFIADDGNSATAPPAAVGGSFFGTDDDDSSGFISQWLTHNNATGTGQSGIAAVANHA